MHNSVKSSTRRARGRPKEVKTPVPRVFRREFFSIEVDELSEMIARLLGIATSNFTHELAHITLAYEPLKELCKLSPMKVGCTNRHRLHRCVLMRDIAVVYGRYAGTTPISELAKINHSREQRALIKLSKGIISKQPPVEAATRAILEVVGEKYVGSLRTTALQARKLLSN